MPTNVEASPSPAVATPTVTPPQSRFNSLKKKRTPSRRAEFNKRLSQVSQKGTGGFLDFLENLGLSNPWYAGEEAETEAETVIDGHYVAAAGAPHDAASDGADSIGKTPSSLGALKDTRGRGGRGVVAETGMIGSPRKGDLRDKNGSSSSASTSAGLTGLNEILDVNNAAPRRRSGVRFRTNLLKP